MSAGEQTHKAEHEGSAQEISAAGATTPGEATRLSEPAPCAGTTLPGQALELSGYRILEELHRGGQGVVYRAIQLGTRREVALKVLLEGPFASEAARRRFEREVELAASLRHPNIVTILDSGVSQGRYYFAMQFIDGLRLDRYLAQVRPPLPDVLRLFCKICDAVNFAHQRGVIHRDLKPPNILVDARGEPHVLDFGLAKSTGQVHPDDPTVQRLSLAGELLGTIAYMSPEQARGGQDVDVRSDVYSLGVIFYEALAGQLPYSVEGPLAEVLARICEAEPAPLRALRRRTPLCGLLGEELETILLKALEKSPARRYQTAGELGRDLEHVLRGEPIEAKRASGWYVFRKFLRRRRVEATAAVLVLALVVGFAAVFGFLWQAEREALRLAGQHRTEAIQRAMEARQSREQLERALHQQTLQRGQAALAQSDAVAARDFFWQAFLERNSPAALWALRQYYWQTGDEHARTAFIERRGPASLSAAGQLVAVCEVADAVTLRHAADGSCIGWCPVPGPVTALEVDDGGRIAAAGRGWGRVWAAGQQIPALAVEFPADFSPLYVHACQAGRMLLAVGQDRGCLVRSGGGSDLLTFTLRGACVAAPDCDDARGVAAVPTTTGIQLVYLEPVARTELLTPPAEAAPLVRLAGDQLFVAAEGAIYRMPLHGAGQTPWEQVAAARDERTPAGDWKLLDVDASSGVAAVGLRDGRVLIFAGEKLSQVVPVCAAGLIGLRLTESGTRLVTLDEAGSVTRWRISSDRQRARAIFNRQVVAWAKAEDGSGVLLADDRGRVFAYEPDRSAEVRSVPLRWGMRLPLPGEAPPLLAVSRGLGRMVVGDGAWIRLRDEATNVTYSAVWTDPPGSELRAVALSGDGQLLALCARTPAAERQIISLWHWQPPARAARTLELPALLPRACVPLELSGSAVRDLVFVPQTKRMIAWRSGGEILLIEPPAAGLPDARPASRVLTRLDSPPTCVAIDRAGTQLAAGCEDGFVRVVSLQDGSELNRLRVGRAPGAIAFSPRADVLLVQASDDNFELIELESAERITRINLAASAGRLATWLGSSDTLLLSSSQGLHLHPFEELAELLNNNRAYALQRAVGRHLAAGHWAAAWQAAEQLAAFDQRGGVEARIRTLESMLRHPGQRIPREWLATVDYVQNPQAALRLGLAAYDGQHFAEALSWLEAASRLADGKLDALAALRLAECHYLADQYEKAAADFLEVLTRPDLDSEYLPVVQLERVAALVFAGQVSQAQSAAAELGSALRLGSHAHRSAVNAAYRIARSLSGLETERPVAALAAELLSELTAEGLQAFYLRCYDDFYFFAGEMARYRGQVQQARVEYQRCIDSAEDRWPADWARYRLRQLSAVAR